MSNYFELISVSHRYSIRDGVYREVLKDINLSIVQNDWISITGPSGSGKTTLLELIVGRIKPDTGRIEQKSNNAKIMLSPQHPNLPSFLTVKEILFKMNSSIENIDNILTLLGITELGNKYSDELSGGELKRVSLAQALVSDPDVLLLDEPTVNLDVKNVENVIEIIKQFHERSKTVIVVSHKDKVVNAGKKILKLKNKTLSSIK